MIFTDVHLSLTARDEHKDTFSISDWSAAIFSELSLVETICFLILDSHYHLAHHRISVPDWEQIFTPEFTLQTHFSPHSSLSSSFSFLISLFSSKKPYCLLYNTIPKTQLNIIKEGILLLLFVVNNTPIYLS